ncbi:MAG: copper transporter [Actinomycetota bacterium]|nr:copper transporter [Actinomycetota bacterium]
MITFRYHVVSLIAVFLALGLGILFGASFLEQSTLKLLQSAQTNLSTRNERLIKQVRELERESRASAGLIKQSRADLVQGTLAGRAAVILSFDSTPGGIVDQIAATLGEAGAGIDGEIQLSSKLDMSNDPRRQQVALAIESASTDPAVLSADLVSRLSGALSGKSVGFIQRLIDTDLAVATKSQDAGARPANALASPNTLVVIVSAGNKGDRKQLDTNFTNPLVKALSDAGVVVAVTEPGGTDLLLLPALRRNSDLHIVTVDGIELPRGQIALALGLQAALSGKFGHYGAGEGTSSPLPQP